MRNDPETIFMREQRKRNARRKREEQKFQLILMALCLAGILIVGFGTTILSVLIGEEVIKAPIWVVLIPSIVYGVGVLTWLLIVVIKLIREDEE